MGATSEQIDTLLLLVCSALTLLVIPGLAFFVGGLRGWVAAAHTFRFAFTGAGIVTLLGVAGGAGMLLGPASIPHVVGQLDPWLASARAGGPYELARVASALTVCAVAAAVVGVAASTRIRLRAWLVFCTFWCVLVLFPAGYAVFALDDGWVVAQLGAVDFGGALPVGIAAGGSAAGLLLACGRVERRVEERASLPLVAFGGSIVWVGWQGLNLGSEGAMDSFTVLIALNSFLAGAGGCLMWMLVDRVLLRRPTLTGVFSGIFAGVVAVTPAAGVLTLGWSLLLGALAAVACATMVDLAVRARFGASMSVIVIVTVASLVGLLYIGLFSTKGGMVESGNFDLFTVQAVAGFTMLIGAFSISLLLALGIRFTLGLMLVRFPGGDGVPAPGHDRATVPPGRRTARVRNGSIWIAPDDER